MKTKDKVWIKASFEIKLAYEENTKIIEDGRIYRCFGVNMSSRHREIYHIPSKSLFGVYQMKLQQIKEMIDDLMQLNVNWDSSDLTYFQSLDKEIGQQINKIRLRLR